VEIMPPAATRNLKELNKYLGFVEPAPEKSLKSLKPKDKQILLLSLEGFSASEIMEQLSVSSSRIRTVLSSDLADQVFDDFLAFKDREFQALYSLTIDAIRDALRAEDIELRLKAADKFLKAHGKYDRGPASAGGTAEDVIRRIMLVEEIKTSRG